MMTHKARKALYCISVCHAWCCKNLVIDWDVDSIKGFGDDDKFLTLRGCTIDKVNKKIIIPVKCQWLTKRNKCKLYEWRPLACKNYECDNLKASIQQIVHT